MAPPRGSPRGIVESCANVFKASNLPSRMMKRNSQRQRNLSLSFCNRDDLASVHDKPQMRIELQVPVSLFVGRPAPSHRIERPKRLRLPERGRCQARSSSYTLPGETTRQHDGFQDLLAEKRRLPSIQATAKTRHGNHAPASKQTFHHRERQQRNSARAASSHLF